jgi:glycoprotein-N-acetylgalactosamine 3-beta-galactosyltransferase
LKRHPLKLTRDASDNIDICHARPGEGVEGKWGYQAFTKVQVVDRQAPLPVGIAYKRVLCIVTTDSTRHSGALRAIAETYAPKCDGFLAASNLTEKSLGAIDIGYPDDATEWQRVRHIWKYIHQHYLDDYDFYFLVHDDTYVIPENLRYQLSTFSLDREDTLKWDEADQSKQQSYYHRKPLYLGEIVIANKDRPKKSHCGGGGGYTLNRAALSLYVDELWDCHAAPDSNPKTKADELMADCLSQRTITCTTVLDEEGACPFHEFGLGYLAAWNQMDDGPPILWRLLKKYHGVTKKNRLKGIAKFSVSFHLVNGTQPMKGTTAYAMRRAHALVHRLCDRGWDRSFGALDEQGNPGYIHDATFLRRNPIPFNYHPKGDINAVCQIPFGQGPEGQIGYTGLQKIRITNDTSVNLKRVMCIVYTHSGRHDRVRAIAETYGPRCDGFMAASNHTDISIGAVNLLHEGPEACRLSFERRDHRLG